MHPVVNSLRLPPSPSVYNSSKFTPQPPSLELEPTLMMLAYKVCYEVQEVDILESQELVSYNFKVLTHTRNRPILQPGGRAECGPI